MKKPAFVLSLVLTILALALPTSALADGIIVPVPPICDPFPCPRPVPMVQLEIRYHHVTVTIQDQVAVTHVDQVFYNPNDFPVEGTYLFPIPQDAAVSSFTLWVDGKPVEGKVLDAKQARQTYEDIVRSLRDPALLEYAGRGAVQAQIFPIPPMGERRVELEYTQALTAENGLVRYIYPLSTEKFSLQPLESVSVNVEVSSTSVPIRAVYSPSHDVAVSRENDFHVRAGYEAANVLPEADFALYYSLGEEEAFHLLTYRDPSDPVDSDGFFLLLLAPRPEADVRSLPKDVILVLDHSGSMEGEKFQQAQEALRYILKHLNPEDRFNIITFSTGVEMYAHSLRPADEASEALPWVDRLGAKGSTDINRALLEAAAIADRERPTYLIFLTDGLPTIGVTESQSILDNFQEAAPSNLRLFAFGVGYDVDTFLLDSLAQAHHGASTYVLPGESLEEVLSGFYEKISTPVLTDLSLDFGEIRAYDIYPEPLPDLFLGSQIIALGRYRESGVTTVELNGQVNEQARTFHFPNQAFTSDSRGGNETLAALPRLWATRKIGNLLNQIRLKGPDQETIDQIVHLSIRYGIVTPYTSYLVTEKNMLGAAAQEQIARETFSQIQAMPSAPTSGQDAVKKAAEQGAMAGAEQVEAPPAEVASQVKIVGARTFVLSNGTWVDTAFDPDKMKTTQVAFLSEDYFKLIQARPDLSPAFALGQRVIALSDGVAYEVVSQDVPVEPLPQLPTATSQPTQPVIKPATPIAQLNTPTTARPTQVSNPPSTSSRGLCTGAFIPLGLAAAGALWVKGWRK